MVSLWATFGLFGGFRYRVKGYDLGLTCLCLGSRVNGLVADDANTPMTWQDASAKLRRTQRGVRDLQQALLAT